MDLVQGYNSDSDHNQGDNHTNNNTNTINYNNNTNNDNIASSSQDNLLLINAAPQVDPDIKLLLAKSSNVNNINSLYSKPIQGPSLHNKDNNNNNSFNRNHFIGNIEQTFIEHSQFNNQLTNYSNINQKKLANPNSTNNTTNPNTKLTPINNDKTELKKKRKELNDPNNTNFLGPWAPKNLKNLNNDNNNKPLELTQEHKDYIAMQQAKKKNKKNKPENENQNETVAAAAPETNIDNTDNNAEVKVTEEPEPTITNDSNKFVESTKLHIPSAYDYQGRSYLAVPTGFKPIDWFGENEYIDNTELENPIVNNNIAEKPRCYAPKTLLHTFNGHAGPVQTVQFLPVSGHLLFSCSFDKTVKIWNCANKSYNCIRTINAHNGAIRDMQLSNTGDRFLTISYDKTVKYFDSETGQLIQKFAHKTNPHVIPYCARLHPDPSKNNSELIIGQSNKLILQYDIRSNEIIQEYKEHLGAVNTLCFIENGNKFISTGDDKKLFIWEYNTPVVIKHISDPDLHSIPTVKLHPSQRYFVAQSMDNQILTFNIQQEKYKLNRKKRFIGHLNASYAIQTTFSPDGNYLVSGDGMGKTFIWDWKTGKVMNKLTGHKKVCIGVDWQPNTTSRLATCSWDGTIKYWD